MVVFYYYITKQFYTKTLHKTKIIANWLKINNSSLNINHINLTQQFS